MNKKQGYLVAQIRSRYRRKYGNNREVKSLIDEELKTLTSKPKLTLEAELIFLFLNFQDLDSLDNKISTKARDGSVSNIISGRETPTNSISPKKRQVRNPSEVGSSTNQSQPFVHPLGPSTHPDRTHANMSPHDLRIMHRYNASLSPEHNRSVNMSVDHGSNYETPRQSGNITYDRIQNNSPPPQRYYYGDIVKPYSNMMSIEKVYLRTIF